MVRIGDTTFRAEVSSTQADIEKGLSERDGLPAKTGMLFVFESGVAPTFWMKGMRFPLDLIWISWDCAVAGITENVPSPPAGTPDADQPRYPPAALAAYTFEVNAGEAGLYGIRAGEKVRFVGVSISGAALCE